MTSAPIRIVPQDEIAGGTAEPLGIKLPDARSIFRDRSARLRTLAGRNPAGGGYLELMAELVSAQHVALQDRPQTWRYALRAIAARLAPRVPTPTAGLVRGLASASDSYLENIAA